MFSKRSAVRMVLAMGEAPDSMTFGNPKDQLSISITQKSPDPVEKPREQMPEISGRSLVGGAGFEPATLGL
jgi:hypothetical protein